jgi:hypothetical protein
MRSKKVQTSKLCFLLYPISKALSVIYLFVQNNQLGILRSSVRIFTAAPLFKETKYSISWDEVGFSVVSYTAVFVNCYWNIHRVA